MTKIKSIPSFAVIVLIVGLFLSYGTFWVLQKEDKGHLKEEITRLTEVHLAALNQEIKLNFEAILSIKSFFKVTLPVSREQFRDFTYVALDRYAAIQALKWIPRVSFAERQRYESMAHKDGYPTFAIREKRDGKMVPAGKRAEYFPVYLVEPFEINKKTFGFDLGSSAKRLVALEAARDSGEMVATAAITLVQENEKQKGFLTFQAIYDGEPQGIEERRKNLKGFVLGVFRISDIFTGSLSGLGKSNSNAQWSLRDVTDQETILFQKGKKDPEEISIQRDFNVGGRTWRLIGTPTPEFAAFQQSYQPFATLFSGLFLTGMLVFYLYKEARKKAEIEQKVEDRAEELRAIIGGSIAGIISIDHRGFIQTFSPAAERIFGYPITEVLGENIKMLMPKSNRGWHENNFRMHLEAGEDAAIDVGREVVGLRKGGIEFPMTLAVTRIELAGKVTFVGIVNDITEKKSAETQLIQAEKLATLGSMVAGVSHEINTPIGTAVINVSELKEKAAAFQKKIESGGISKTDLTNFLTDTKDYSAMAQDNLVRAAELIRSFKQVAVDQSCNEMREFDLLENIDATIITMRHEFRRTDISFKVECKEGLMVNSLPGAFSQIITNLAHNSLIHGFDNGRDAGEIKITVQREKDSNRVIMIYADNGVGLNDEQREKIFDPFFTTRRDKGGSGLGMHIVQNLVTQTLGGVIRLRDVVGHGVRFRMDIPV